MPTPAVNTRAHRHARCIVIPARISPCGSDTRTWPSQPEPPRAPGAAHVSCLDRCRRSSSRKQNISQRRNAGITAGSVTGSHVPTEVTESLTETSALLLLLIVIVIILYAESAQSSPQTQLFPKPEEVSRSYGGNG